MKPHSGPGNPVHVALSLIGGRWKAEILFQLMDHGMLRFAEIQRLIPGVRQKMLTRQLRALEHDGLVRRLIYPQVPPKVEYSLTDTGRTLRPVLSALRDWGAYHGDPLVRKILAAEKPDWTKTPNPETPNVET